MTKLFLILPIISLLASCDIVYAQNPEYTAPYFANGLSPHFHEVTADSFASKQGLFIFRQINPATTYRVSVNFFGGNTGRRILGTYNGSDWFPVKDSTGVTNGDTTMAYLNLKQREFKQQEIFDSTVTIKGGLTNNNGSTFLDNGVTYFQNSTYFNMSQGIPPFLVASTTPVQNLTSNYLAFGSVPYALSVTAGANSVPAADPAYGNKLNPSWFPSASDSVRASLKSHLADSLTGAGIPITGTPSDSTLMGYDTVTHKYVWRVLTAHVSKADSVSANGIIGVISALHLPVDVVYRDSSQTFSGINTFTNSVNVSVYPSHQFNFNNTSSYAAFTVADGTVAINNLNASRLLGLTPTSTPTAGVIVVSKNTGFIDNGFLGLTANSPATYSAGVIGDDTTILMTIANLNNYVKAGIVALGGGDSVQFTVSGVDSSWAGVGVFVGSSTDRGTVTGGTVFVYCYSGGLVTVSAKSVQQAPGNKIYVVLRKKLFFI